jgi:outer membrane protein assembly factor BamD (BamD/ComL family)
LDIAPATEAQRSAPLTARYNQPATAGGSDLREQIAVLDSARAAMAANADGRALETLRRYQDKYPAGSFRPEAAALKIEALVKLGRHAEARALAERFDSDYGQGPLAERVAQIAGLAQP